MSHLNEDTLEQLISASASPAEVTRIRRHVDGCRACARRLEEWRDNFPEVDQFFPELAEDGGLATTLTSGGMMVVSPASSHRRWDFANLLWIAALLMALLVGYGAQRMRASKEGLGAGSRPTRSAARPAPPVNTHPAPPVPEGGRAQANPRTAAAAAAGPEQDSAVSSAKDGETDRTFRDERVAAPPVRQTGSSRPAPIRVARPPARTEPTPSETARTLPAATPGFRQVRMTEAARLMRGRIRLMDGMEPDHIEIGPGSAVPGAQAGLDVIRVVYRTPEGSRILLDQQLIPADSSGFRPIDDPTLETGETAYGTAPNGVSVATWLDEEGYRISLVVQAPVDSLRKLVELVR